MIIIILFFLLFVKNELEIFYFFPKNFIIILFSLSIFLIFFLNSFFFKNNFIYKDKNNFIFFDFLIWLFQFFQIYFLIKLLSINLNLEDTVVIFGLSLIAGLFPLSLGGFGIRDYFIILQLKNQVPDQDLLMLILLFNLRYLIPIVCGLFFSIKRLVNEK